MKIHEVLNGGVITPERIAMALGILMEEGCSIGVVGHAIYVWCDDSAHRLMLELNSRGHFYISMVCTMEDELSYRCYDLEELGGFYPAGVSEKLIAHCLTVNHVIEEVSKKEDIPVPVDEPREG